MARPTKTGLEYFPLDVDMDQDDKLFFIEAKHGLIGFAVVVRLLMLIYKDGYYKQYTKDKEAFMLAKRLSVEVNVLNNIVNDCINEDIFNKKLFEQYGILTSRGIQKRYLEACARRKEVNIFKEYCLIDPKNYKNLVFEYINPVIVDINPDKCNTVSAETPQSKVKESKEKKNINNMHGAINTPCQQPAIITLILNDKSEYPIAQSQIDEWKDLYPAVDVLQQLKNMKGWLIANPTKRKTRRGILRFINSWLAREQDKGMQAPKSQLTKTPNKGNFTQRKYDNDYFDKLYKEV